MVTYGDLWVPMVTYGALKGPRGAVGSFGEL